MRRDLFTPLLAVALLALPSCKKEDPESAVELSPCWLPGLSVQARCVTVEVFEDRERPEGRKIDLRVAVVPAKARDAEPDPLFLLVGGPGQAATEAAPAIAELLSGLRRARDIVLVDQRGTGGSSPLDCGDEERDEDELSLDEPFRTDELRACLESYEADPRLYTTPHAMDDLDEVREALGYDRINIWGGSYGSRAALVYLRRHPSRVRSLILDGVAPVDLRLPLFIARDSELALRRMLKRCAGDPFCAEAYPDLGERLRGLLERLQEEPMTVTVAHPRTGRREEVRLDRDGFAMGLLMLLYSPHLVSLMPGTISQAAGGELAPFFAQVLAMGGSGGVTIYPGKLLSVACAEDVATFSEEEVERLSAGTLLGDGYAKSFMDACSIWPRGELPEGYADPVVSDAPVLILSGELDPVTPPKWGELVARTLSRSRHLVVPGAGHGVIGEGCVPGIVADFIEAAAPEELDLACAEEIRPPSFFHDFAGPRR